MQEPPTEITLDQLPVGSRLLVRSRTDWRFAAISKVVEERVVLTVCSPSGHTYRLRRDLDTALAIDGEFYVLPYDCTDTWRENFSPYDVRW
jgi:hypothetical protein